MKLHQTVDQVKRNTEEMSELSKELTNVTLGVSSKDIRAMLVRWARDQTRYIVVEM